MRRLLALFVVLALCISCVPAGVFADGDDGSLEEEIDIARMKYQDAVRRYADAETEYNTRKKALDDAQAEYEKLTAACEKPGWYFLDEVAGPDCTIEKLTEAYKENEAVKPYVTTEKYEQHLNSATEVENILKAVDYIDECNDLRAREGKSELKINGRLMVFSVVSAAISSQVDDDDHVAAEQLENTGSPANTIPYNVENLAWDYDDPFKGWYDFEKRFYDNALASGNYSNLAFMSAYQVSQTYPVLYQQVGHYLNIIDGSLKLTGFAHTSDPRVVDEQSFGTITAYTYGAVLSTEAFRTTLSRYQTDLETRAGNAKETYESAKSYEKAAKDALDQAAKEVDDALAAYRALAGLPTPTGLKWHDGSNPFLATWDFCDNEKIVKYYVKAYCTQGENTYDSGSKVVYVHDSGDYEYDFKSWADSIGPGEYWFTVIANPGEKPVNTIDSFAAESPKVTFYSVNSTVKIVDDDGNETGKTFDRHGTIFFYNGGYERGKMPLRFSSIDLNKNALWYEGVTVRIVANSKNGYRVESFEVYDPEKDENADDREPADLEVNDNSAEFTLDRNYTVIVKIRKDDSTVPVTVDFSEDHSDIAETVTNYCVKRGYTCSRDGSVITLEYPFSSMQDDVSDIFKNLRIECFSGQAEVEHNGEIWNYNIGSKPMQEYSSEDEFNQEAADAGDKKMPEEGMYLYVHWKKKATKGRFTVTPLTCGTEVKVTGKTIAADGEEPDFVYTQTPAPVVTADKESEFTVNESPDALGKNKWYKNHALNSFTAAPEGWLSGKIKGGETYYAGFNITAKYGYYLDKDDISDLTVNGGKVESDFQEWAEQLGGYNVMESVKALHDVERVPEVPADYRIPGEKSHYRCRGCGELFADEACLMPATKKELVIPALDPKGKMGKDGTALGKGAGIEAADKFLSGVSKETDPAGSGFMPLFLRSTSQKNKSIKLTWKKASGAKYYVIYGNKCGKKNKLKKISSTKKNTYNIKKISSRLKKGTYYKFIVVAVDKNDDVVSTSRMIHVATKGGKVGNYKKIQRRSKSKKIKIKKGKAYSFKTKCVPVSKKKKVKKCVPTRYESSNSKIASVSRKGVIRGKKKGSCYVYAFAQNGVYCRIKVTVK